MLRNVEVGCDLADGSECIRRLLYGEGYTIRGVQRILKENGIKAVQGLVDGLVAPAFAAPKDAPKAVPMESPFANET
eukprot:gene59389-biopygen42829